MRNHPETTTLMKDHLDERPPWDHHLNERPPWWETFSSESFVSYFNVSEALTMDTPHPPTHPHPLSGCLCPIVPVVSSEMFSPQSLRRRIMTLFSIFHRVCMSICAIVEGNRPDIHNAAFSTYSKSAHVNWWREIDSFGKRKTTLWTLSNRLHHISPVSVPINRIKIISINFTPLYEKLVQLCKLYQTVLFVSAGGCLALKFDALVGNVDQYIFTETL